MNSKMKYHLIACGGAVMHNVALALHEMGHSVTGSDDEIFDPARQRLLEKGLLPPQEGWFPEKIHADLDAVILGMHAKADNPELLQAQQMGVKIYSFPEFMYAHSQHKKRVVIAGSHGKTTITSMILHVLKQAGWDFDYLVGAKVQGFETMVRLTKQAPILIVEGDEYLSSPIDRRPKFLLYHPHIALISGIAWDHVNVFPKEEMYNDQFRLLVESLGEEGHLVYYRHDKVMNQILSSAQKANGLECIPYEAYPHKGEEGKFFLEENGDSIPLKIIGNHNMQNLAGAWEVLKLLGLKKEIFLQHISSFTGAGGRLETIWEDDQILILKDFAHSPSKVKATTEAVSSLFGKENVLAVYELHTFSSLNAEFLPEYKGSLKGIDRKLLFVNRHTLEHKGMPPIPLETLRNAFGEPDLQVLDNLEDLISAIQKMKREKGEVLLMMSSGNFGGLDIKGLKD